MINIHEPDNVPTSPGSASLGWSSALTSFTFYLLSLLFNLSGLEDLGPPRHWLAKCPFVWHLLQFLSKAGQFLRRSLSLLVWLDFPQLPHLMSLLATDWDLVSCLEFLLLAWYFESLESSPPWFRNFWFAFTILAASANFSTRIREGSPPSTCAAVSKIFSCALVSWSPRINWYMINFSLKETCFSQSGHSTVRSQIEAWPWRWVVNWVIVSLSFCPIRWNSTMWTRLFLRLTARRRTFSRRVLGSVTESAPMCRLRWSWAEQAAHRWCICWGSERFVARTYLFHWIRKNVQSVTLLFSSIVGLGNESLLSCCLDLLLEVPDPAVASVPLEEGEDSREDCCAFVLAMIFWVSSCIFLASSSCIAASAWRAFVAFSWSLTWRRWAILTCLSKSATTSSHLTLSSDVM